MVINQGPFKCPSCPDSFALPVAAIAHAWAKHGIFVCPFCGSGFKSQQAVDQHCDANHCFECPECDKEFVTEGARDQHYGVAHRWIGCPMCDCEFRTQEAVVEHCNAEHHFECPECHSKFTTKAAMDQHYAARHLFVCPYHSCFESFITEAAMSQHYEVDHCFRCVHCPDTFTAKWKMTQHCDTKHNLPCPECTEKFATTAELQNHKCRRKRYPCIGCSADFKTEGARLQHFSSEHSHRLPPPSSRPHSQRLATKSGDDAESPPRVIRNGTPYNATPSGISYTSAQSQEIARPSQFSLMSVPNLQHHIRVKHPGTPIQAWTAQAQPPVANPESSVGFDPRETNGQHREASDNTNLEVRNPWVVRKSHACPKDHVALVDPCVIGNPPPEVVVSGATQYGVVSSASDNAVRRARKHFDESDSSFLAPKTTSNSKDQAVHVGDRNPLPPKGPTLSILVEIDPKPRRGLDETTYQIASDTSSPTTTISSIETDEPEECDIGSPSHSLEFLDGNPLEKLQRRNVPPRGPKLGDRKSYTMSNTIVAGGRSGSEPHVQAQDGPGGIMPSTAKGSDSPTFTSLGLQDMGTGPDRGDPLHNPLRTAGSGLATTVPEICSKCRICLSDPTPSSNLTATHCGHLFCYECIVTDVLKTSRCPVCQNALALYCLFKLDAPWQR